MVQSPDITHQAVQSHKTHIQKSTKLRKQHTGNIIGYRAYMTISSSTSKLRYESTCYREEF